jgi:hypothetical protein
MKTNIIKFLLLVLCLSSVSCVSKKRIYHASADEYSKEELVVIEFATRMEEQEHKYEDYHKTKK